MTNGENKWVVGDHPSLVGYRGRILGLSPLYMHSPLPHPFPKSLLALIAIPAEKRHKKKHMTQTRSILCSELCFKRRKENLSGIY